ncbi:GspE/PulE family protein [Rhodopirellula europaea]|uniref:General secretory pathway protein E n=2 Tax=Rhodopirellula TaxID=265488 RepID=M5SBY7_9BACT|nr:GspE/PulE family protein [Rhodopirellula europaea]EMI25182.1 general secretory pathway protein E [Rhodopirellula europaea SH398]
MTQSIDRSEVGSVDCESEAARTADPFPARRWTPDQVFVRRFPIEFCRRHQALVATDDHGKFSLLHSGEAASRIVDNVGRLLGRSLPLTELAPEALKVLINQAYEARATELQSQSTDAVSLDELLNPASSQGRDDLLETDARGPVVQLVNSILLDAIQQRASDVHLQPFEDSMVVRMRIDGVLVEVRKIPKSTQDEVVSRLKVAGQMNIAEKRLPQDGRATVCVGDRVIDLRLASMPTSYGERVVVRLLDKSARMYSLSEIGMDAATLQRFSNVIHAEHGLVLVTGPTGSGKSTTLYGALTQLDTSTRNAVTLEDPIEYQLDGISQTQINTKKGMTFASGLRSVLRQDPDIIMLGEIRDEETAIMAVQSALTGHLVFSTLHTNDAASAVTRMLDLGIEPYLVSSSLLAVLAQRLVRRVCVQCHGRSSIQSQCDNCRGTGYHGREGIYELLVLDDEIRELIQKRAHASHIRDTAITKGMRLLRDSGLEKVEAGVTTSEEIQRVTMQTSM